MGIKENIDFIKNEIEKYKTCDVLLVPVTKLHDVSEINEAISYGITDIAENKVQEILAKYDRVINANWHLIGHLQTNKVKYIIDKVKMIHSVDSFKLALEIDKRAKEKNIVMDILVQVNVSKEESKYGVFVEELPELLSSISRLENVNLKGLMYIAPYFDDVNNVRPYFKEMKVLYEKYKEKYNFSYLSMGMSHDFRVALEEGSNLVRIGTQIFGARDYAKKIGN